MEKQATGKPREIFGLRGSLQAELDRLVGDFWNTP